MFDKDNSLILVQFPYKLSLVRRFVDDLIVPVILDFSNFMYLDKQSIGGGIYPK
jgi:heptaprenylglyceryl phosphate synthase